MRTTGRTRRCCTHILAYNPRIRTRPRNRRVNSRKAPPNKSWMRPPSKNIAAVTYSPTTTKLQYHQREWA